MIKKQHRYLLLGVLILGLVVIGIKMVRSYSNEDFRLVMVNNNGLTLKSVSWKRRMVNDLKVGEKVYVWIPDGMGWYQSQKLDSLLTLEKKRDLIDETVFFNYGFSPDVVLYDNENWLFDKAVVAKWGLVNVIKYWWLSEGMMNKTEELTDNYETNNNLLNVVAQRDFADSRILNDYIRINIYNQGNSSGLATFISLILERNGFNVVGVDNINQEYKGCQVNYGDKIGDKYSFKVLKKYFDKCSWGQNNELGDSEVELYFDDSYAQMLNYASYLNLPE